MGLADGREIKLVFRIVRINEIVGDSVCQHEIPREIQSCISKGIDKMHLEREPGDQGLVEIASLDIKII
jgi:hypothetical protein